MEKQQGSVQGKENEVNMSRRVFLGRVGKLMGLGVLTHFVLIGKAHADSEINSIARVKCSAIQTNSCEGERYSCTVSSSHTCKNRFTCGTFTCTPNTANNCNTSQNNCNPISSFTPQE